MDMDTKHFKKYGKSCLVGNSWCYGRYFTETSPAEANSAGMRIEYGAPTTEHNNTPQDQPPNLFTARLIYLGFLPWHWPLESIGWAPSGYRPCRSAPKSKHDLHRSYRCLKRRSAACCLGSRSKKSCRSLVNCQPSSGPRSGPFTSPMQTIFGSAKMPFLTGPVIPFVSQGAQNQSTHGHENAQEHHRPTQWRKEALTCFHLAREMWRSMLGEAFEGSCSKYRPLEIIKPLSKWWVC